MCRLGRPSHKLYLTVIFIIFISWTFVGCGDEPPGRPPVHNEDNESQTPPPNRDPADQNEFCYSNNGAGVHCLEIVKTPEEYGYRRPTAENGFPQSRSPNDYHPPIHLFVKSSLHPEEYLSKNFQWKEFFTNDSEDLGMVRPVLIEKIQEIRSGLNRAVKVNSAYRSPKYNSTIAGSATWSRHTFGDAADMASPGASLAELKQQCEEKGASYIQVYTTHVHCDWRRSPKNSKLFPVIKDGNKGQPVKPAPLKIVVEVGTSYLKAYLEKEPAKEDDAPLLYEWEIQNSIAPDKILKFQGPKISWQKESGDYAINVTVGGYQKASRILSVK